MSKEVTIFEPGLPTTNGWTSLSETKQKWLQEKTSNIKKFGAMEGLASVSGGIELLEVKNGLKNEAMGITDYLKTIYGAAERSGFRKLADTEELVQNWPADLVKAVAERGALLLRGTAGIGIKDLIHVSRELPAPKERDDKTIDSFIENKVRAKLKEHKAIRRAGKTLKVSEDDGLKILFNSGRRIFRSIKGTRTSAEWRQILKTVNGWWMEDLAIPGSLECKRISIPDGTVATVGRPRSRGKEKEE